MTLAESADTSGRRGRRIAAVIYWLALAYIVVVGFYSVVPAVFWPKTTAPKTTAPKTTAPKSAAPKTTAPRSAAPSARSADATQPTVVCSRELDDLRTTLAARGAEHIRASVTRQGADPELREFFAEWDRRWLVLKQYCDRGALDTLEQVRHQMEVTLDRYDHQEGQLFGRLRRELQAPPTP